MKNVAIMISSLKGGGAERVASLLSQQLFKKYNLYLIVFDSEDIAYQFEGNLIDLKMKSQSNFIFKTWNAFFRLRKVKLLKKELKIDTTISFLDGPNIINILSRKKGRVIVSVRNYVSIQSKGIYGTINKYLIKKIYNRSDKIIGVSNVIKKDLISNYGTNKKKIVTIYNFYDLERIRSLAKEPLEEEYQNIFKSKVIITVGRLNHFKGQWHLIRAFKKINNYNKEFKLIILGSGELESYLRELIKNLELEQNICLLGFKNNPYKYIYNSDLFILPSLSEGFPNTLVEAVACDVPVVSSDCKSGPREILAPDTDWQYQCKAVEYATYGTLVPVCDGNYYNYDEPLSKEENIMADTLLELLNNEKLQKEYKKAGKSRVEDFGIKNLIKEWEKNIEL
ncbi:glycosyltransferase [Marinisporobacter balticus]|uniref:Glycosyltransferase involved in cell wall biosynthesis n=1 Tax=Marinisporobacter balticus TaxID=2018667 RepID=A0A4R2L0X2_9FIRM|nr:glycosyltransferase [Marinisporobacter balticus]TCO78827.1 glycosyltransferase involved in cell wall biosynthesis [Marinisporobacter balticus]